VVYGAGILDAQLSGHAENYTARPAIVNTILLGTDPFTIQPVWADGHSTGIYSFDYLKRIADEKPGD
jgi:DUF971 family protein